MLESKILIIPSEKLDPDVLAATFSLARVLMLKEKVKTEVLFDKSHIPSYLEKIFPFKDIKFTTNIEPQGFIVKLKSIDAKIKDIKWEEKDGEINLFISAENGKLDRKATVRSGGTNYQKIITIGIEKLEELGEIYTTHKDLFDSVPVINIDTSANNSNFGENTYVNQEASSLSEIAFNYLSEEGVETGAKEATDLLSGIFWKTKSFEVGFNKSSTFQACAELINQNGDVSTAIKQVYQTLNLAQLRFLTEILKSAEVSPDGIAWALVRKNQTNALKIQEVIFPEINLLAYLENIKVAFILVEIGENKVYCDIRSNQKAIKASKIASSFGANGTPQYANFYINNTIENARIQLTNTLRETLGSFSKGEAVKIEEEKEEEESVIDLDDEDAEVSEMNKEIEEIEFPEIEEEPEEAVEKTEVVKDIEEQDAGPKQATPLQKSDEPAELYDPLPPAPLPPIDT